MRILMTPFIFILLFCSLPVYAAEENKPSLVVPDVRYIGEGELNTRALTGTVAGTVHELGEYRVLSQDDVRRLLDVEQQRQMMGCEEDACMIEFGVALGARFLLACDVGDFEGAYSFSCSLIDVQKARSDNRISLSVPDASLMTAAARVATLRLFGHEAEMPEPGEDTRSRSRAYRITKYVTLGLGLALVGVGGTGTGLALDAKNRADNADTQNTLDGAHDDIDRYNTMALSGYIVGGALVATSVVFFVLDALENKKEKPDETAYLPLDVGTDGRTVFIQTRFVF